MSKSKPPVLVLHDVHKSFEQGKETINVLQGAFLEVHPGEVVALLGPSGAGKTTLLQIAGLLDKPSAGNVRLCDKSGAYESDETRAKMRLDHLGMVYQLHHLLWDFTALENVMIPQMIAGVSAAKAKARAAEVLRYMHIEERMDHKPAELSGGQQQRVAIARAIVNRPSLLLADEPTGNLDPETADQIFQVMIDSVKAMNSGLLVVTHNTELAKMADRAVILDHGVLKSYDHH